MAAVRLQRGRRIAITVALMIFFGGVLVAFLTDRGRWSVAEVAVVLAPALFGAVLLVVFLRWLGREQSRPQLLFGASRRDQRAVQHALRTGQASDPRIDALSRDTARHNLRWPWLPWLYAVVTVLQGGLLVLNLIDGDLQDTPTSGLLLILWCLLTWQALLRQRRSRRYLADATATAVPDIHQP